MVSEVRELLQRLTRGELGPEPVQVVIATHSAELLNFIPPEAIRFVMRDREDGGAHVLGAPTEDAQWNGFPKEHLGSMERAWLSGSPGGVPGC